MGQALEIAYDLLATTEPAAQRFVLLLTDGEPDPVTQQEVVAAALARFQQRPDWPLFAIALGDEARVDYLRTEVTGPGSGQTFPARSAGELVDLYLQIYELLLDDRYIESLTVPPDQLAQVAAIIPEHELRQLSFILHLDEPAGRIDRSPGRWRTGPLSDPTAAKSTAAKIPPTRF